MVMNIDEYLLPSLLDAQAKAEEARKTSAVERRSQSYGQIEGLIEEFLPTACSPASIISDPVLRRACRALLEDYEDEISQAVFSWIRKGDDEVKLNREICLRASGACPKALGELSVPRLDAMDLELAGNYTPRSMERPDEPAARYNEEGLMAMLVGSSFMDEVIYNDDRDALVYFAFPDVDPEFDANLGSAVAEVAHDVAGPELLVAFMNMDRNTVPDPFGTYIKAPCLIFYRRGNKFKPVMLQSFHGKLGEEDTPTAEDIFGAIDQHASGEATKLAVFEATTKRGMMKAKEVLEEQGKWEGIRKSLQAAKPKLKELHKQLGQLEGRGAIEAAAEAAAAEGDSPDL